MSYYYIFKEENLTEDQKRRLYDLTMELGPRNDVSYREHIAEIRAEAGRAGFVAGLELADSPIRGMLSKNDLLCRADEYAAKVRQGGE